MKCGIQYYDIQNNDTCAVMLIVIYADCQICWVSFMLSVIYADCRYAECRKKPFMLSVFRLNVVMLSEYEYRGFNLITFVVATLH